MVRIVEGGRAAIESRVVEIPLGRSGLPDQPRELTPILFVAGTAAIRRKIELVPPFVLGLWRQRHLAGFLIADEIAAHRHHGLGTLWPERCEDIGGPRSPVKAGENRLLDLESVKKVLEIGGERRWLAIPDRLIRKEARAAIAAQVRSNRPKACRSQQRRDINEGVNVVWPAVQKDDHWSIGGTGFCVTNIKDAGINLLQRSKGRVCSRLDCRHFCLHPLGSRRTDEPELSGGDRHFSAAKEAASIRVDFVLVLVRMHWSPPGIRSCPVGSAEREGKGLNARSEEFDSELSIGDGLRLSDQLIQALLGHRTVALLVNIDAVSGAWGHSINAHAESDGRSWCGRTHH